MKTIIVKTQKELDAVKDDSLIIIDSSPDKVIEVRRKIYEIRNKSVVNAYDNAVIQYAYDNAVIQRAGGNAVIQRAYDNAVIQYAYGNAVIQYAYDNAVIQYAYDNAVIENLIQESTLLRIDNIKNLKHHDKTARVVNAKQAIHDIISFKIIYPENVDGRFITLYKSVNPETLCDFYAGKIKYEGVVTCPDWDPDQNIQCGNGLHLSPTPEMALSYNQGKVLKCKVALKDIVVFGTDITKVRCKKVEVIGEWK
jgi:hypothetical protein